eukprot:scaffold14203_cov170-Amphora_coffeaeformis.AAC.7
MKISGARAKMLKAMAALHSIGNESPTKKEVAMSSSVGAETSTFRNACAFFKKNGLAKVDAKTLNLTQLGHDKARKLGDFELPDQTNDAVQDRYRAILVKDTTGGKKAVQFFNLLVAAAEPLTKQEMANSLGMDVKKSTFRNGLAPLNKLKLLKMMENGKLTLIDDCFPFGRPS